MISYNEFTDLLHGGESRNRPGTAVDFILVVNHDGQETFYAEWAALDDDAGTGAMMEAAYDRYRAGDSDYIRGGNDNDR